MNQHDKTELGAARRSGASVGSITELAHRHYPLFSIAGIQVPNGWIDRDECVMIRRRLIEIRAALLSDYPADVRAHRIVVINRRQQRAPRYIEDADATAEQKAEVDELVEKLVAIGRCSGVLDASGLEARPVHVLVAEEGWVPGVDLAQIFGDLASAS